MHVGGKKKWKIRECLDSGEISAIGEDYSSWFYSFEQKEGGLPETQIIVNFGPIDPQQEEVLQPNEYRNSGITYVRFRELSTWKHPFRG